MGLRERISEGLKTAMLDRDTLRLSTLRLITAAIKDRDIALRSEDREDGATEDEVLAILAKMVKQRQESARAYEEAGRLELAEDELSEIKVIEEFLPKQLTADETASAIEAAIASTGATSIRDMGKVMGELKSRFAGRMDFGSVGSLVKAKLA